MIITYGAEIMTQDIGPLYTVADRRKEDRKREIRTQRILLFGRHVDRKGMDTYGLSESISGWRPYMRSCTDSHGEDKTYARKDYGAACVFRGSVKLFRAVSASHGICRCGSKCPSARFRACADGRCKDRSGRRRSAGAVFRGIPGRSGGNKRCPDFWLSGVPDF